jgi:thioredoxin-related protein
MFSVNKFFSFNLTYFKVKKVFLLILGLFLAATINAQKWETNLETAKKLASEKGRNIVLVFSGSDWCAPCMKLEKNIWESKDFIDDSDKHFVLLRADFPKKKANSLSKEQQEQNGQLAETYNKQGLFPLVAVLDKNGKLLGTTGYKNISPKEYVSLLHSLEK